MSSFVLFPAVDDGLKDERATYGVSKDNFYLRIARAIKSRFPEAWLMSDVAMDPYSSDGHDGVVQSGQIVNDLTLPILADMAVVQAEAGFDSIGPSDMMDGRVGVIRDALDAAGHTDTGILSYTAKYAARSTVRFVTPLKAHPSTATRKPTRWIPPIGGKRCVRPIWTWPRAQTCSWSNQRCATSM